MIFVSQRELFLQGETQEPIGDFLRQTPKDTRYLTSLAHNQNDNFLWNDYLLNIKFTLGKFTILSSSRTSIHTYTQEHYRNIMAKICEKNEGLREMMREMKSEV